MGRQTCLRRFIYSSTVDAEDVPTHHQCATVCWSGDGILQLTGYSKLEAGHNLPESPAHLTFAQWLQQCPMGLRWAVDRYASSDNGITIVEAIRQSQAIVVCDGSYKDGFGTAVYVLEGSTSLNRLVAVNVVPGFTMDQSSYQSKLAGLYGVVAMVQLICEQYMVTSRAIEVGCNSSSALNHVFGSGHHFDANIKQADYDLHSALRVLIAKSPIMWTCPHVAGHHQDDDNGIEVLDRWAKLNIEMDSLAKVYWNDMDDLQHAHNLPIAYEYWPVCI